MFNDLIKTKKYDINSLICVNCKHAGKLLYDPDEILCHLYKRNKNKGNTCPHWTKSLFGKIDLTVKDG